MSATFPSLIAHCEASSLSGDMCLDNSMVANRVCACSSCSMSERVCSCSSRACPWLLYGRKTRLASLHSSSREKNLSSRSSSEPAQDTIS